jgi:hypothetical protein
MSHHLACVALLLSGALLTATAQAAPRCDQPRQPADRIACAKAAEGPDALRRFVTRTQAIYQLYYWDYVPAHAPAQAEAAPLTVAAKE